LAHRVDERYAARFVADVARQDVVGGGALAKVVHERGEAHRQRRAIDDV
jgi:hypothetical protein